MKNITMRIDEKQLEAARRIAADRSTSVNAMIREFLEELVNKHDRRERARRQLVKMFRESKGSVGEITWKREDLYDR